MQRKRAARRRILCSDRCPRRSTPAVRDRTFGRKLRAWYRRNARDLPWRRTRDAYEILVSELMLQQTQVSRVVTTVRRVSRTISDARRRGAREAGAGDGGVGGPGLLRSRAKSSPARRTRSPTEDASPERALPADAGVRFASCPGSARTRPARCPSFAYERRAALVDTNVARVLKRVFAPSADVKTTKGQRDVWELAKSLLPRTGRATWTHNQALMELGALVCTARVAHCGGALSAPSAGPPRNKPRCPPVVQLEIRSRLSTPGEARGSASILEDILVFVIIVTAWVALPGIIIDLLKRRGRQDRQLRAVGARLDDIADRLSRSRRRRRHRGRRGRTDLGSPAVHRQGARRAQRHRADPAGQAPWRGDAPLTSGQDAGASVPSASRACTLDPRPRALSLYISPDVRDVRARPLREIVSMGKRAADAVRTIGRA